MVDYMGTNIFDGDDTRAVLDGVRRIVQALRESSRQAEKRAGLTSAQLFVLQKLAESPAVSLNALAARTYTHQSSVSAVVSRLVDEGFVVRVRSLVDGRSTELSLSPKGRRAVARSPHAAQERLIRGVDALPAKTRRQLAATLAALASTMDAADREPEMFFEDSSRRNGRGRHV